MKYAEKLKDPRWQKKRLEVFNRDNFTCQFCKSTTETLAVHHLIYVSRMEPWDYPLDHLLTLCQSCHTNEYENREGTERELLDAIRLSKICHSDLEEFVWFFQGFKPLYGVHMFLDAIYTLTDTEENEKALYDQVEKIRMAVSEQIERENEAEKNK